MKPALVVVKNKDWEDKDTVNTEPCKCETCGADCLATEFKLAATKEIKGVLICYKCFFILVKERPELLRKGNVVDINNPDREVEL